MKKFWFSISMLTILALAACRPAIPATMPTLTQPAPQEQATVAPQAQPTREFTASEPATCRPETVQIPDIQEGEWVKGPADAPITMIEYSDFQCPYCGLLEPVLEKLLEQHGDQIRFVFRHFPLSGHDKSRLSAQAAEAAGKQGKFWEMHDLLFEKQQEWASLSPDQFPVYVKDRAAELNLDVARFESDMQSDGIKQKVTDALNAALQAGIGGTPYVYINGSFYQGDYTIESIQNFVKFQEKKFKECPPMAIDPSKEYTATISTEKGDIVIRLFPDKAPMAVNNFIFLAKQGWYDNTDFFAVIPEVAVLGGDPSGTGTGTPGFLYTSEVTPDLRFDRAGLVGMDPNGTIDSNGSRFFITLAPLQRFDGYLTIFGEVVSGMDIVNKFEARDPSQGSNLPPAVKVKTVTIAEK